MPSYKVQGLKLFHMDCFLPVILFLVLCFNFMIQCASQMLKSEVVPNIQIL